MVTFCLFGLIFIGVGTILLHFSLQLQELSVRYDDIDHCNSPTNYKLPPTNSTTYKSGKSRCTLTIKVTERMAGPVYFYYQLDNFNQNHRSYVKSRDYK